MSTYGPVVAATGRASAARHYASLSGRDLGAALRVSEAPQARGYAIEAAAGAADLDSFSIEPGVLTVRVAITARWALL